MEVESPKCKINNFVIIGLQSWDTDIGSNCKSIALEISKYYKVLYINMPLDRATRFRNRKNKITNNFRQNTKNNPTNLIQVNTNLYIFYPRQILESLNWIPTTPLFKIINRINSYKVAKAIKDGIKKMNFKDYVIFNDNDILRTFNIKNLLQPKCYIYYCRDYLRGVKYWKRHSDILEPLHIKSADIALANSTYLANYLSQYNDNSYYIGQGCNLDLFNSNNIKVEPEDLKYIGKPRIGYVGSINSLRINPEVIRRIALANKTFQIVLVGPEDTYFKKSDLHDFDNIHFLGKKEINDIPTYINYFDICINPQVTNEVTIGNYPLKIDEYLAMGKPVVATKTLAMEMFEEFTYVANNPEEYNNLIIKALNENNSVLAEKRRIFANEHTWEKSVKLIFHHIDNFIKK